MKKLALKSMLLSVLLLLGIGNAHGRRCEY